MEGSSPGSSPGILTVKGNYVQSETGILEIEVGGTEAGVEYDLTACLPNDSCHGSLFPAI